MELDALAKDELVDESVGRRAPRLGQARRHGLTRARPDHGVVQRVEGVVRGDGSGKLGRVEPPGCRRKVEAPCHLAFGRGGALGGSDGQNHEENQRAGEATTSLHGEAPFSMDAARLLSQLCLCLLAHRDREREGRALAQLTLDPNPRAVQLDQLPTQRPRPSHRQRWSRQPRPGWRPPLRGSWLADACWEDELTHSSRFAPSRR